MSEKSFTVKYVSVSDSFLYVPNCSWIYNVGDFVKVIYGDDNLGYFSINQAPIDLEKDEIGFDSLHAKVLGIQEGEIVFMQHVPSLPSVKTISIAPFSRDDYQVLEILAEKVQSTLLNQIKVVYSRQKFVIWIGSSIHVSVCVEKVDPISPGVIEFLTEVQINPQFDTCPEQNLDKLHWLQEKLNPVSLYDNGLRQFYNFKPPVVYRMIPLSKIPDKIKNERCDRIFEAYISNRYLPPNWPQNSLQTPIYCSITLLSDDMFSSKVIYVKLIYLQDINLKIDDGFWKNIYMHDKVFEFFECGLGARVLLEFMYILPKIDEIEILCRKNYLIDVVDVFKTYIAKISGDTIVLNKKFPMDIGSNVLCELRFLPGSDFCIVDDSLVKNCKFSVEEENITLGSTVEKNVEEDILIENIASFDCILQSSLRILCKTKDLSIENVLIEGKHGTGKSSLLKSLQKKLNSYPRFIYTEVIKCKSIKGKTMDSLWKLFSNTFAALILRQPSVLFLDDIHVLCERAKGDEAAPNNIYYDRISEMLQNLFKLLTSSKNSIGILATTESIEKINKNIYSSRGLHLFKNAYKIEELSKDDRYYILEKIFSSYNVENVNLEEIAKKTDGYVMQDSMDLFNKIIFEAAKDDLCENDDLTISQAHCDKALNSMCVLALQNVNLHAAGDKDLSDIGGLGYVKETLVESLLWPTQYPSIFSKAPLRLQSGLLLYGPPGTGKTILVAAAAKQCRLRLISVKGPELLSKYIGASEQAVRDIFQKAQSVRPCILFFDEFDSLAPRRGHDNTGVTDRVVNQLLTQLDGVEALTGVCVVAATSRPDLLDPALLRPGRLDKQILCPLPSKEDRFHILRVLSKHLDLSSEVNLEEVAVETEFFSGADLQSLLYTAQMSTIEHLLLDDQDHSDLESVITQEHLLSALKRTKPSLSGQERKKYERIYHKFQTGSTIDGFETGTKATLA